MEPSPLVSSHTSLFLSFVWMHTGNACPQMMTPAFTAVPGKHRRRRRLSATHRVLVAVAVLYVLALAGSRLVVRNKSGLFTPITQRQQLATGRLALATGPALAPELWASGGGGGAFDRAAVSSEVSR